MTLLSPVFSPKANVEDPGRPLTDASLLSVLGGDHTASGVVVSERSALGLSAVWRAINLIAGTSASLPLHAYEAQSDVRNRVPATHRASRFLDEPHPDLTPFELWEIVYAHIGLWGNAYLRMTGSGAFPLQHVWPIHPGRVRAGRTSDTGRKVYAVSGGKDGTLEAHTDETILHIPGFGYDGICGVSPIRAARQGLGLAMAAEEYGAKLFGSGSLATGILQTEQRLTPEQADAIQTRWKAKRAGLGSAHSTIVLDSGAKFAQLSIPPEDAQFIESRKFQVSEVARMFGIPPHMLMDTEKSTSWGSGIEQQAIGFVTYTLRPWLTRVEQRLSKVLRPNDAYAKYAIEGLLRGDSAARSAFYKAMWDIGALSTNEIRALEERAAVEGGDVRYRPLNMGELGSTDTTAQEGS